MASVAQNMEWSFAFVTFPYPTVSKVCQCVQQMNLTEIDFDFDFDRSVL